MKKIFRLIVAIPMIMGLFACSVEDFIIHTALCSLGDECNNSSCSEEEQTRYAQLDDGSLCREFFEDITNPCLEIELESRFAEQGGPDHCAQVLEN
tara:strand:- start:62 stop:349 length:288 start_codon:yes stop_codon:yes gene_type:complete